MSKAEAFVILNQWAGCRCSCTRAPTDPCRCEFTLTGNRMWTEQPVSIDCDKVTPKDRRENRE